MTRAVQRNSLLRQSFEGGKIVQNIMEDFEALRIERGKVVACGVQELPGFGDLAACGRSNFC